MNRFLPLLVVLMLSASELNAADQDQAPRDVFRLFDGQPTRLYFTGNPHHPTFGREKLAKLLDRFFDGKSPFVVDGLADARKDPVTQKPIRPAKIPELIRFLEPVFEAREAAARKVGWDSLPVVFTVPAKCCVFYEVR